MEKNNQLAGAIIVAGILIAGAILIKGSVKSDNYLKQNPGEKGYESLEIRTISADEHILGNPEAKIKIVEYSDTECPFCKIFHQTMHNVVKENPENVAWVYRHYPIEILHPKAFKESLALECAWEQGGNETFWKYTDELYKKTPSNNKLEENELTKIAQDLNLDLNKFKNCVETEKYADKIENDINDGISVAKQMIPPQGGLGTPTSLILKDGKVVDIIQGAEPFQSVNQKIQNALKD